MKPHSLSSLLSPVATGALAALALALAAPAAQADVNASTIVATGPLTMVYDGACLYATGQVVSGPIGQYECLGTLGQTFAIAMAGDGVGFNLASANSGMCVTVNDASLAAGALVSQTACGSATNQRFMPIRYSDGSYLLVAENSGMCLEVPNASMSVVQLDQGPCTGAGNQRFNLPLPAGDVLLGGQLVVQATGAPVPVAPALPKGAPVGWDLAGNAAK